MASVTLATKHVMAHRRMVRLKVFRGKCSWCGAPARVKKCGNLWRYGTRRQDATIGWFKGRYCDSKCRNAKRYSNRCTAA